MFTTYIRCTERRCLSTFFYSKDIFNMQHIEYYQQLQSYISNVILCKFFQKLARKLLYSSTQFVTHYTKTAFFSHRGNLMLNIFLLTQARWALYLDNGYKRIPITLIDVGDHDCIESLQSHDKPISQEALLKTLE